MKHKNKVLAVCSKFVEKKLDILENRIPSIAQKATKAAYQAVLKGGSSVMVVIDNSLYEVFPDGRKTFVKKIESDRVVGSSRRLRLK